MNNVTSLEAILKARDYSVAPIFDGNIKRFDRISENSGWYRGFIIKRGGRELRCADYGDWVTRERFQWIENEASMSPEELAEAQETLARYYEEERIRVEAEWVGTATYLLEQFELLSASGELPEYLKRKQIDGLYGARTARYANKKDLSLYVPMLDVEGKFWNFQKIIPLKIDGTDKFFQARARVTGCFHTFGSLNAESPTVYIAEGFATSASVFMGLGKSHPVLTAFNAGNLSAVAESIRAKFPSIEIVVVADNDAYTEVNGVSLNVGVEKARAAAAKVNGRIVIPTFSEPKQGLTDFNDLHCVQGLDEVTRQLHLQEAKPAAMVLKFDQKKQKAIKPSEKQICDFLLNEFGDHLVREGKSIFRYTGTHWVELDDMALDKIKQFISSATGGVLSSRELESAFKFFYIHCPQIQAPASLLRPSPYAANFADGTLHLAKKGLAFELLFQPHSPTDYLTSVLPFKYPRSEESPAPMFHKMLNDLWDGNPDKAEILSFIQELMGAVLCPAFPIIVHFHGKPNSGKSMIIKLLVEMISKQNTCSVQPCDMFGFNMESMVGKLLNYDLDINVSRPMVDHEMKKIIDRVPRRIQRKYRPDVDAHIPAVHLFAGNGLPRSRDGGAHAYGRRLVVIRTNSFDGAGGVKDFEKVLWSSEAEGILQFALAGLKRVAARGSLLIPESSVQWVKEIETEADLVAQFLDEIAHGGIGNLQIEPEKKVYRTNLWEWFNTWQTENRIGHADTLTSGIFYRRMEERGFILKKINEGQRYFFGIGSSVDQENHKREPPG